MCPGQKIAARKILKENPDTVVIDTGAEPAVVKIEG